MSPATRSRRSPHPVPRPPWCGTCDNPDTRLVDVAGGVKHCQRCHPRAVATREALAAPSTQPNRPPLAPGPSAPSATSRQQHRENARRIIVTTARLLATLSANDVRAEMVAAGIPASVRSRAFQSAEDEGLLERAGHVPSTAPATKGHELRNYRSLALLCRACGHELGPALARAGAAVHADCPQDA